MNTYLNSEHSSLIAARCPKQQVLLVLGNPTALKVNASYSCGVEPGKGF